MRCLAIIVVYLLLGIASPTLWAQCQPPLLSDPGQGGVQQGNPNDKPQQYLYLPIITAHRSNFSRYLVRRSDMKPTFVHTDEASQQIAEQYIVLLNTDTTSVQAAGTLLTSMVNQYVTAYGGALKHQYDNALLGFAAQLPPEAIQALHADPRVLSVEPDVLAYPYGIQYPAPWGLDRLDQPQLPLNKIYAYGPDGTDVNVYIIDTGILSSHSEFGDRVKGGINVTNKNGDYIDCNGHGTHVAATVAGSHYGAAKQSNLYAVRVFDKCSGPTASSDIIAGLEWVTANHTKPAVVNMSIGTSVQHRPLDLAVRNAVGSGITVVAAAGNARSDACTFSPAREDKAITVGATDSSDDVDNFSNWGKCIDIYGPGTSIKAAGIADDESTAIKSGTSMSAPYVTGAVALYLSIYPDATPAEITTALLDNATPDTICDLDKGSPNRLLYTGFIPEPEGELSGYASLGDRVWWDANRNGVQDDGESGVQGMTIRLYIDDDLDGSPSRLSAITTTDFDGLYHFSSLDPALGYAVQFMNAEDQDFTTRGVGDGATDSDAGPFNGLVLGVRLEPNVHNPDIDAGLVPPRSTATQTPTPGGIQPKPTPIPTTTPRLTSTPATSLMPLVASIDDVSSGAAYEITTAEIGIRAYTDQLYPIQWLNGMDGLTMIRTTDKDRDVLSDEHLTLTLNRPAILYAAFHKEINLPSGFADWTLTSGSAALGINNSTLVYAIYSQSFPAGEVTLAGANNNVANYILFAAEDSTQPAVPTPIVTPIATLIATPMGTITPTVPAEIVINFQTANATPPADYLPDSGEVYGERHGYTYGWNVSHESLARQRQINADPLLDTIVQMTRGGVWEIAVPNGRYSVAISVGDPGMVAEHTINVEGINYWSKQSTAPNYFVRKSQTIVVNDGRLTVDQGDGDYKQTRINYIEITYAGPGDNTVIRY